MKALVILVLAVVAALVAQFLLEPLADRNDLWHWIQHGILFWSGIAAGIAGTFLYRRGQLRV